MKILFIFLTKSKLYAHTHTYTCTPMYKILFSCKAELMFRFSKKEKDRQTGEVKRSTELRCTRTTSTSRNKGAMWGRTYANPIRVRVGIAENKEGQRESWNPRTQAPLDPDRILHTPPNRRAFRPLYFPEALFILLPDHRHLHRYPVVLHFPTQAGLPIQLASAPLQKPQQSPFPEASSVPR